MVDEYPAELSEQQQKLMKARAPLWLAGAFLLVTALVGMRLAAVTRLHPSLLWLIAPGAGIATALILDGILRLALRSLRLHGLPEPQRLQRTRNRMILVYSGLLLLFGTGMGIAGSITGHPAMWFIAAIPLLLGVFMATVSALAVRRAPTMR